jgi:hypothetical protein
VAGCVAGTAAAAAALFWRPWGWPAALSASTGLIALCLWGILDRELEVLDASSRIARRMLQLGRVSAAAVGWLALGALAFSFLGVAIGRWKS